MPKGEGSPLYVNDGRIFFIDDEGNEVLIIELKDLVIRSTTGDPGAPVTGQIWFRSDI